VTQFVDIDRYQNGGRLSSIKRGKTEAHIEGEE
jgi:hypothetical protein